MNPPTGLFNQIRSQTSTPKLSAGQDIRYRRDDGAERGR